MTPKQSKAKQTNKQTKNSKPEAEQIRHHSKEHGFRLTIKMQPHFRLRYQAKYKAPEYSACFLYYKNEKINLQ